MRSTYTVRTAAPCRCCTRQYLTTGSEESVLDGMLVSYESVVNSRVHRHVLEGVAPGMLKFYDLQDLVAALAPRDVWIVVATDPLGHELPASEGNTEYGRALGASSQMREIQSMIIRERI